jgi:hypothetical protein
VLGPERLEVYASNGEQMLIERAAAVAADVLAALSTVEGSDLLA